VVERRRRGYAKQPGPQVITVLQAWVGPKAPKKGLLNDVFGIVPRQATCVSQQLIGVILDEQPERWQIGRCGHHVGLTDCGREM
jgi:hypothetical protein